MFLWWAATRCCPATEIFIPVGNLNSQVGIAAGVYSDAHAGHGFGTHNTEGERVLEFTITNGLSTPAAPGSRRETLI